MRNEGRRPARPNTAKRVLVALGLATALIAAAELGVQTWARYFRSAYETYDRSAGTPDLVPGLHESKDGTSVEVNEAGFLGAPLAIQNDRLSRIVALGDSCTAGTNRHNSYPAMLQKQLQSSSTDARHYEVVNAAIAGLDSQQALRRLLSTVPTLEPEIVTIYLGWNDLMKFAPRSQTRHASFSRLSRSIDRLWLVRGLRKLLFYHLRPLLASPLTGPSSHRGRFDRFNPTHFEENMRAIVHATREFGARAVLLTLPSPIHEKMQAADLRRARIQFPYYASCYAVGDLIDLLESYNRSIRRVGVQEHAIVVDLARRFQEIPHASGLFWDTMHPSMQGRDLIARLLASALIREALVAPPATSSKPQAPAHTN